MTLFDELIFVQRRENAGTFEIFHIESRGQASWLRSRREEREAGEFAENPMFREGKKKSVIFCWDGHVMLT